jgi:NAD(P)-dependent dehydrogenase (short-subunit alcohol dehydrogenase family)
MQVSLSLEAFSLKGEVALITGGGTGIGLAIARGMAASGAQVVIVGRRESPLREACAAIGERASFEVFDVTDFAAAEPMLHRIAERVGPVSILANNAGIHLKRSAVDTTVEAFNEVLQTHVLAAHNLTRAVLPGMLERKHGNILFTASMASLFGLPMVLAYAAAKSAYLGMVRTLATEVSPHGVRVNAIAPGWIETDITRRAVDSDPPRKAKILSRTPMGRMGQPEDIGWGAVYLCSPAARFVTGAVLPIDGGASIGF